MMSMVRPRYPLFTAAVFILAAVPVHSADWPMWRHDTARTACTADQLPGDLTLHWSLRRPAPRPAWPPEQGKVRFDASYEPVSAGGRVFVPSMVHDSVTAYDLSCGARLWEFFADGPVRFAPVVHGNRLLFVSDDGYLYCLNADDGSLHWRFRGGPEDRWLLGNNRMISMWPARGAPVTYGDTVYFAAGIWPFMGTFLHAVDIYSGRPVWTNSGSGSNYLVQQHSSPAFAGVAPQGYLAVNDQYLLVSGGKTVPAAYDRATGRFLYFRPGDRQLGKDQGGYEVMLGPDWFANRGGLHLLSDGAPRVKSDASVLSPRESIGVSGLHLVGLDTQIKRNARTTTDRKGKKKQTVTYSVPQQWKARLPEGTTTLHLQAGNQLLLTDGASRIVMVDRPAAATDDELPVAWSTSIEGTVWRMLVADGRLIVATQQGGIFCFGSARQLSANAPRRLDETVVQAPATPLVQPPDVKIVDQLLGLTDQRGGYAVIDSPRGLGIATKLAQETRMHLLLMQPDVQLRRRWRQQLAASQLLGTRVAVLPESLPDAQLPPYFAELVLAEPATGQLDHVALVRRAHAILRPYSGVAMLGSGAEEREELAAAYAQAELPDPTREWNDHLVITRVGPLPGSGTWTSQQGDAGNTLVSAESNVRAPLGMLWFGGPSNRDVLPRHGHGPTPQVIGGRLFIEGRNMLRAVDVYTGRLLWQREFPDVGIFYDNTDHHAGATAIGGNFVTTADSVYLVWGRHCLRLDPATGETLNEFHLPPGATGQHPYWGYLRVYEDYLIAGCDPMLLLTRGPGEKEPEEGQERSVPLYSRFGEGSHKLLVMDRLSGKVRWEREAQFNFRHNAIAIGDGKLFCLDRMTDQRMAYFRRRGEVPVADFCLYALDLATGAPVWQSTDDAFGTWLAYEPHSQLLVQAGSKNRDRASDEVGKGMAVFDARTGHRLWRSDLVYGGPPLLYPDRIITQGTAIDMLTGEPIERRHPLTDEVLPWKFTRNYGCCTAIGCANLLTFRSAAAGYFDLERDGGTGNFGGFRTGCTANLIAADGVLSAPDYTRTCTCSYQNQCSLALIHMPDVEMWTFDAIPRSGQRVRKLGVNFGAPGDRRGEDGTLWLDYPSVGGPSPDIPITVSGDSVAYTRRHMSTVEALEPKWVFASGVHGAESVEIRLAGSDDAVAQAEEHYTIRLFITFGERADADEQVRVRIQGQDYDLPSARRSPLALHEGGIYEYANVPVGEHLRIELDSGASVRPVICGMEIKLQ